MANYLYNGVELPDINTVWTDKTTHPYACICDNLISQNNQDILYLTDGLLSEIPGNEDSDYFAVPVGTVYQKHHLIDGIWTLQGSGTTAKDGLLSDVIAARETFNPIWANYNVLNTDGSAYLAASEPVPVGGSSSVVEMSGDGYALYNGVMLPNIDSVLTDKTLYKNAVIAVTDCTAFGFPGEFIYGLGVFNQDFWFIETSKLRFQSDDVPYQINDAWSNWATSQAVAEALTTAYSIPCGYGASWAPLYGVSSITKETAGDPYTLVFGDAEFHWSNYDILNTDGTVYLAASEPISLEGMNVITWDGNTDGLTDLGYGAYQISDVSVPEFTTNDIYAVVTVTYGEESLRLCFEPGNPLMEVETDADYATQYVTFQGCGDAAIGTSYGETGGVMFAKVEDDGIATYPSVFAYPASSGDDGDETTNTYDRDSFLAGLAFGLLVGGEP